MRPYISALLVMLGLLLLWYLGFWTAAVVAICAMACILLSLCLGVAAAKRVHIRIDVPSAASKGSEVPVSISADVQTRIPIGPVLCRVSVKNCLTFEEERLSIRLPAWSRNGDRSFSVHSAHCGYTQIQVESARIMDWFGMIPGRSISSGSAAVTVMPELFSMQVFPEIPSASPEDSPEYADDRIGSDYSETYQLREYQEGDSLRAIHWKLTAKQDKLIVRDPAYPVSRSLLVFWDKRGKPAQLDAMADVAASLCKGLLDAGFGFHFGWIEQGRLYLEEINDEDALLRAIPMSIRNASREEPGAILSDIEPFGKTIYIGEQLPANTAFWGRNITALLINPEKSCEWTVIPIPTAGYAEALQTLEL